MNKRELMEEFNRRQARDEKSEKTKINNIRKKDKKMNDTKMFIEKGKETIVKYMKEKGKKITANDVYIVWLSKTLQNTKGLFSTNIPDGMYYELTYNGDKKELYFDAYKKVENLCIPIK